MDPKPELVPVDEMNIGLDRSKITSRGQIQIPEQSNSKPHDNELHQDPNADANLEQAESRSSAQHMKESVKQKKHHVGIKLRKTLHINKASDQFETSNHPVLANDADTKSDSRLDNKPPTPEKHTMKNLIHNPIDTVKSKVSDQGNHEVAANIAAKEVPHGQEVDLVNASTAVERARTENERLLAIQNLSKLLKERQNTFVRWTLDRHVTKLRVLPRDTVTKRPKRDFEKKNARGEIFTDWKAYATHVSNTPYGVLLLHIAFILTACSCLNTMLNGTEGSTLAMDPTRPLLQKQLLCQTLSVWLLHRPHFKSLS